MAWVGAFPLAKDQAAKRIIGCVAEQTLGGFTSFFLELCSEESLAATLSYEYFVGCAAQDGDARQPERVGVRTVDSGTACGHASESGCLDRFNDSPIPSAAGTRKMFNRAAGDLFQSVLRAGGLIMKAGVVNVRKIGMG